MIVWRLQSAALECSAGCEVQCSAWLEECSARLEVCSAGLEECSAGFEGCLTNAAVLEECDA